MMANLLRRQLLAIGAIVGSGLVLGVLVGRSDLVFFYIILLAIALAVGPFALQRPYIGLAVFIFITPFGGVLPAGTTTLLPLLGAGVALLWLMSLSGGGVKISRPPYLFVMLLLAAVILATATFTNDAFRDWIVRRDSAWIPALTLLQLVILTFLATQLIRSREAVIAVTAAVASSTTVLAIVLIIAFLLGINGDVFRVQASSGRYSALGLVGGTAPTSLHFILGLAASLALYRITRAGAVRIALVLGVVALLFGILLTVNLSGVFVACVVLGVFSRRRWTRRSLRRTVATLAVAGMAIVGLMSVSGALKERVQTRLVDRRDAGAAGFFGDRYYWWTSTGRMVLDNPLGIGAGRADLLMLKYAPPDVAATRLQYAEPDTDPHNLFLSLASELGIVGIGLFGALVVGAIRSARSVVAGTRLSDVDAYWLAQCIRWTIVAILLFGMTSSMQQLKHLWLYLGIALVLPVSLEGKRSAVKEQVQPGLGVGLDQALLRVHSSAERADSGSSEGQDDQFTVNRRGRRAERMEAGPTYVE